MIVKATDVAGVWYRSVNFNNKDNGTIGSVGVVGNNSGATRLCLGVDGHNVWESPTISILPNRNVGFGVTIPQSSVHAIGVIRTDAFYDTNSGSADTNQWLLRATGSTIAGVYKYSNGNLILCTNDANRLVVTKDGNVGIGDNQNIAAKLQVAGNGLFSGNVTAQGDVVAYSATSNVRIEPAAGASALFDLTDVELPADLTNANNFVLAYDVTKKKWTAKESAGTGGAPVDYTRLSNVPTTFTPCNHSHEEKTYVSDMRLKENIMELPNALNTVLSLKGKSFSWSDEAKQKHRLTDDISYGYIAQDVKDIIPNIVKELESGDGYMGVEYIKVIPFITEAIRELHNHNVDERRAMKKEITTLKRIINENKQEIDLLKEIISSK